MDCLKADAVEVPQGNAPETLRDRFELLSAYLDGEITAVERRQVEDWLDNDPAVQCLYARLLKLRQGMRSLAVPQSECSPEQTATKVFSKLDRRPQMAAVWGGMAIAALFIGAFSNSLPGVKQSTAQVAQTTQPTGQEALMIALDRPVIEIPKAAVSAPNATAERSAALNTSP